MNNNNWDLHAVVRGCCCSSTITSSTTTTADLDTLSCLNSSLSSSSNSSFNKKDNFVAFSEDPFEELHGVIKPFLPKHNQPEPLQNSPISSSVTCSIPAPEKEKQTQIVEQKRKFFQVATLTTANTNNSSASSTSQPPRSKRRKNQHKKVCHVREDALSSDIWAWRKYGQKPIKGSPYPRGYYRCSSSKGCLARKQVERNRSDPTMFIVTYTAEHNHPAPTHRNSLAGSTRQKPNATQVAASVVGDEQASPVDAAVQQGSCSSPGNSGGSVDEVEFAMKTESITLEDTVEDDEDELVAASDMSMSDDFFDGLDDFIVPASGDCSSDRYPTEFGMNWAINGSAATAAGGG